MSFEEFRRLIADITHIPVERISETSAFREDLGIDSLRMVNLVTQCLERFGAGIDLLEDADALKRTGSFYQALMRKGGSA